MRDGMVESLEEFWKSFHYGSRTDLLFKFLAILADGEAAEFIRVLLERLGDAMDTGDYQAVIDHVYEWQAHAYSPGEGTEPAFEYSTGPWSSMSKPLSESRLALISSGGLYLDGDDPMGARGPTQEQAIGRIREFTLMDPVLVAIPSDVDRHRIRIRHPGYDIRGAMRDYNVVFPIDRLKELTSDGVIGELANESYSFVGVSSQKRLLAESAPRWAKMLVSRGIDAALLVAV